MALVVPVAGGGTIAGVSVVGRRRRRWRAGTGVGMCSGVGVGLGRFPHAAAAGIGMEVTKGEYQGVGGPHELVGHACRSGAGQNERARRVAIGGEQTPKAVVESCSTSTLHAAEPGVEKVPINGLERRNRRS